MTGPSTNPDPDPDPPDPPLLDPLDRLSVKLAEFQTWLEPDEAELLAGILAIAADALGHSGNGPGRTALVRVDNNAESASMKQGDAPPQLGLQLLSQFSSAFTADEETPDQSRNFIIPAARPPIIPKIRIIP